MTGLLGRTAQRRIHCDRAHHWPVHLAGTIDMSHSRELGLAAAYLPQTSAGLP